VVAGKVMSIGDEFDSPYLSVSIYACLCLSLLLRLAIILSLRVWAAVDFMFWFYPCLFLSCSLWRSVLVLVFVDATCSGLT
jgi:hypothetical protein